MLSTIAGCCLLVGTISLQAAEPIREPSKQDLFEAGKEGYGQFRIPGIVVTKNGIVLAYCEARRAASTDWGQIDVMLRRSTDGGATWSPMKKIVELEGQFTRNPAAVAQQLGKEGEITVNNPIAIADPRPGVVHFLYCVEYNRLFYMRSDDDGLSFGKPAEITAPSRSCGRRTNGRASRSAQAMAFACKTAGCSPRCGCPRAREAMPIDHRLFRPFTAMMTARPGRWATSSRMKRSRW